MKKIGLNNSHAVLYLLSDPVGNLSRLVGAEAPIHLLLAGSCDAWNRGFNYFYPTNFFGVVGISTPTGRHRCSVVSCWLTSLLFFG